MALIDEKGAEHGRASEQAEAAAQAALRYLNRRERTVSETWRYLAHQGFDAAATEAAVNRLVEGGYLDDARYARLFAEDRRNLDQWGAMRIRRALLQRGIEQELVDLALSAHGPEAQLEQALALLKRRFPTAPTTRRERDRALGMLLRRGYQDELVLEALAAYAKENRSAD